MSRKSARIATFTRGHVGRSHNAHYLGYFECFNSQRFFEAHEVLEELWLLRRGHPDGAFYKGLIQLAGAFVHLQKHRPGPALALFNLAQTNLQKFPASYQGLDLESVLAMIEHWIRKLPAAGPGGAPVGASAPNPQLPLPAEPTPDQDKAA